MTGHSVAILLATYNGSEYIREFLESLLAQTYTDFKLIVRDDGSTDDTLEIIRNYSSRIKIDFIATNARLGPAKSFFELITHANDDFDFYFFADQDDYWHKSKIERAVEKLSADKENVALYCSRLEYVDENLAHIKYSIIPRVVALENALVENIATGCTIALTRPARRLIVDYPPGRIIMHDWWFYMVNAAFGKVIYDRFPSIKYRQHSNNTIGAATNLFQDFNRRLNRFIKSDGGIFGLATQAMEFKRCFASMLTGKQLELVDSIIDAKAHIVKRLRLALFSRFIRQRWGDTLILKILFMAGRF